MYGNSLNILRIAPGKRPTEWLKFLRTRQGSDADPRKGLVDVCNSNVSEAHHSLSGSGRHEILSFGRMKRLGPKQRLNNDLKIVENVSIDQKIVVFGLNRFHP